MKPDRRGDIDQENYEFIKSILFSYKMYILSVDINMRVLSTLISMFEFIYIHIHIEKK